MSKPHSKAEVVDPDSGSLWSPRFLVALVLIIGGIAWIAWYYTTVRVDPLVLPAPKSSGPAAVADLGLWNYAIGFGAILLGLIIAAHKSTPLGRGQGVVVGMLGCFLIGLFWIVLFYVFANQLNSVPVMNDLGQWNLAVGIGFMAVGFTYATKWE